MTDDSEALIAEREFGSTLTIYVKDGWLVVDAWEPDQQVAFFLSPDETRKLRLAVEHYAPMVEQATA